MMNIKRILLARQGAIIAITAAVVFPASIASAQLPSTAEQATRGSASSSRVEEQFTLDQDLPDVSPSIKVKDLILQQAPEGAENIRFNLSSIQLDGVSAYSSDDLRPVYADKLGQNISLADIYAISTALTNKYRNDGYILTQVIVPPQTIDGGTVKLRVVEGYIDNISIEGSDQKSALSFIKSYAAKMRTGQALNVRDLERHLLLINDLPGVEARSVLSPSKTQTGAADLRIMITRDPYDAFLGIDNFGSRYLGPIQLSSAGSVNSIFGNNERISGQFIMVPDSGELAYFSATYEQPVSIVGNGSMIELGFSNSNTVPGYDLTQFDVKGHSQVFSAKLNHPFIRSRSKNLRGHVKFDMRDVNSNNDLEDTRKDRIRTLRAGGSFEFLDQLFKVGVNSINMEISQGLNIFGSSDKGDDNLSRAAGDPQFTKMNIDAQRLQRLTSKVNLLVAVRGQWASNPLLSSEEFGVGGTNIGRGFDSSEIIGDEGLAGKLELQWNAPYPWWDIIEDYQLYSFYDAGTIWNKDATTSSLKTDTVTSAGVGMRADLPKGTKAGLAVAFPLNRDVQTQQDRGARVYMNLSRKF